MTRFSLFRLTFLFWALCVGLGWASTAAAQDSAGGPGEVFTLNLKNADITTLIATVSEVTGRNFVIDPRVKGQVTVLSAEPMTPEQLYEAFLSVLEVHGFAAVPAGEVIKIIPQINAKQDGGFGAGVESPEDIITRVIKVDNVPADQLVPILRPLVPQYGHLAANVASNSLIISDRTANVQRIARIVEQIDRRGMSEIESIRLQHASATEVVRVIEQLQASAGPNSTVTDLSVVADVRTNSIIVSGDKSARLRLRAIIADLDTQTQRTGGTRVIYLDYADAEEIAPVLQNYATAAIESAAGASGTAAAATAPAASAGGIEGVSVIAEPGANALVVTAPADAMRQIVSVIEQLDIRRGQVLIEAIIVEVSLNRSRQLGVNIAAFGEDAVAAASILDSATLNAIPSLALDGTPLGLIQQGLNVALGSSSDGGLNFALLINALSGNTNTNILSTPSLITLDNEEAEISVGQEVPFVTGNFTSGVTGGGGAGLVNPFQTIERKEVGLSLGVTPQINAGDTIQMAIDLEISSIAQGTATSGAVDLITNTRSITTSVAIDDGQILVLGGLISNTLQESVQKVPILSDIPILGALFTNRSVQKMKRNLLNFIRPTILRGGDTASYYTRKKYNYIRSIQERQALTDIPLMPEAERPELPPIEEFGLGGTGTRRSGTNLDIKRRGVGN